MRDKTQSSSGKEGLDSNFGRFGFSERRVRRIAEQRLTGQRLTGQRISATWKGRRVENLVASFISNAATNFSPHQASEITKFLYKLTADSVGNDSPFILQLKEKPTTILKEPCTATGRVAGENTTKRLPVTIDAGILHSIEQFSREAAKKIITGAIRPKGIEQFEKALIVEDKTSESSDDKGLIIELQNKIVELNAELETYRKRDQELAQIHDVKEAYLKDMVQSSELGKLLNFSRQYINGLRRQNKLIAVNGKNGNYYPTWQVNSQGQPYECIEEILNYMSDEDPWDVVQFFYTPLEILDGSSPKELLPKSGNEKVLQKLKDAAASYLEHTG